MCDVTQNPHQTYIPTMAVTPGTSGADWQTIAANKGNTATFGLNVDSSANSFCPIVTVNGGLCAVKGCTSGATILVMEYPLSPTVSKRTIRVHGTLKCKGWVLDFWGKGVLRHVKT
jgi:hypothetical protein